MITKSLKLGLRESRKTIEDDKIMHSTLNSKYKEIHDILSKYRDPGINERNINFYQIKYLLNSYEDAYNALNDEDKAMVNKYLYEECNELIKTFNGIQWKKGIVDLTDDLYDLRNIKDISEDHFKKLTNIYSILMTGRDIQNLFSGDISNLKEKEIADILLKNILQFNLINHELDLFSPDSIKESYFSLFAKIIYFGNGKFINNLTAIHKRYVYFREQYEIYNKLEYSFAHSLPIDPELIK